MVKQLFRGGSGGFTLIELLIVIAIIALLAVAVLAAINPIEQINKSRDTGKLSDASQLISAVDRFYARDGLYPWNLSTEDGYSIPMPNLSNCPSGGGVGGFCNLETMTGATSWLLPLVSSGEVKDGFVTRLSRASNNPLKVVKAASSDTTYICFEPMSRDQREVAGEKCGSATIYPTFLRALACPTTGQGNTTWDDEELICLP